jgi:hypothetical protein
MRRQGEVDSGRGGECGAEGGDVDNSVRLLNYLDPRRMTPIPSARGRSKGVIQQREDEGCLGRCLVVLSRQAVLRLSTELE